MKTKGEASQLVQNFCMMAKTQSHTNVKIIRSDNGYEFTFGTMKQFYEEQGIIHRTTCVDTPQQNGQAERKHRYILNVARALRFQANLPIEFWEECVLTSGYLINRTPSSILHRKTLTKFCLVRNHPMPILKCLAHFAMLIISHDKG